MTFCLIQNENILETSKVPTKYRNSRVRLSGPGVAEVSTHHEIGVESPCYKSVLESECLNINNHRITESRNGSDWKEP